MKVWPFLFMGSPLFALVVLIVWTDVLHKKLPPNHLTGIVFLVANLIDTAQTYFIVKAGQEFSRTLLWQVEHWGLSTTLLIKAVGGTIFGAGIYLSQRKVQKGSYLLWVTAFCMTLIILENMLFWLG